MERKLENVGLKYQSRALLLDYINNKPVTDLIYWYVDYVNRMKL